MSQQQLVWLSDALVAKHSIMTPSFQQIKQSNCHSKLGQNDLINQWVESHVSWGSIRSLRLLMPSFSVVACTGSARASKSSWRA